MEHIIEGLKRIAVTKNVTLTLDTYRESCPVELWRRSVTRWNVTSKKAVRIIVYYSNIAELIEVLAHEIGHVETTHLDEYSKHKLREEQKASQWALDFLARSGYTDVRKAKARYAQCLRIYKACENDTKKYPLKVINVNCKSKT